MTNRNRTIATASLQESVIKKSRFICSLARASSEEEARAFIAARRAEFWDASHNCSAWVVGERGELQRSSDDGEPAGTAGSPMLNALNQRELTDTVAVVTRYFGGTLLGAGGLIRAYGQAVTNAIEAVGIVERRPLLVVAVSADHDLAGRLEYALHGTSYHLAAVEYGDQVTFTLHLDERETSQFGTWLAEATGGRCQSAIVGVEVVEVPAA